MPLNSAQLIGTGLLDGFRNRIINGDMRIFQRNTAATVDSAYAVDRWKLNLTTDGTVSVTQSTDNPSGFNNSLLLDVVTADTSIGASQYVSLNQPLEGLNTTDLAWGTAGAKTVTVSFWVKASGITAPQTYCVSVRNGGATRSYVANFTVNTAATWEYKTVTIPGDTTGTWAADNTTGIILFFTFAAGTSLQTTANTWAAGNFVGTSSIGNLMSSTSNEVRITGVQLEVGSVATEFERRSYGTELALCQRYYFRSTGAHTWGINSNTSPLGSANWYCTAMLPVTMRNSGSTACTFTLTGGVSSTVVANEWSLQFTGQSTSSVVVFNAPQLTDIQINREL